MSLRPLAALIPLVAAVACAAGPAPEAASPEPVGMVAVEVAPAPSPVGPTPLGSWTGSYVCTQGLTGLDLTVEASPGGQLVALFRFYGLPGNPTVPSGAFRMSGRVAPDGRVVLLASEADWIEHPRRYIVVGLAGAVSADGTRFTGVVTNGDGSPSRGCTTFSLMRQQ